jgi:uncharacterized protein (DUF362 family)
LSSKIIGNPSTNPFLKKGKSLVSKVKSTENPRDGILNAVDAIGGFKKFISRGDNVLLKPNCNSSDVPPASTEPQFLKALVELLYENGAGKVVVGESSWQAQKTRNIMKETGTLFALEGTGAKIAFFDEGNFVKVNVNGEYLKSVNLSEIAMGFDKLIYCCCMKTHFRADFSLSLKLGFGFTKKSDRVGFHLVYLKEKLVDLNLVIYPNLILMDGRTCFISGGPFKGEIRKPNLILASGDRIAIDIESIKVISSYEGSTLNKDPWSYTQIQRAIHLGLGAKNEEEYIALES